MKSITKLLLPLLFISLNCSAIVIRHDKDSELYQVDKQQYPSVINLEFLMGTLIDPEWILTAAHGTPLMPGGQEITIGGYTYTIDKIIPHPNYSPESKSPEHQQDHDIALLKLNKAVPDIVPSQLYTGDNETSQTVWFVGEGYTGNGIDGITGTSTGLMHAQNIIDQTDEKWLYFDFDTPEENELPLEGVSGPGDSGGPAFINNGNRDLLAGVSSHQLDNESGEGNVYGVTERYTRVSQYAQWIQDTMNMSDSQLHKVALDRPKYQIAEASDKEMLELIGTYNVEGYPPFTIEQCEKTLCYRWEGQPRITAIYKTQEDLWFTTKVNRTIEVQRNENGDIQRLLFKGYQGGMSAVKR